jgi:molybdopterin/thiamine biosynthesis adenylyltransferase
MGIEWLKRGERLRWELGQLDAAGYDYADPGDLKRSGVIPLRVYVPIGDERHTLDVKFPELYPSFRFEVVGQDLALPHHQNPFSKGLCLLGRKTENWRTTDSLAAILREQFPQVLAAGNASSIEAVVGLEEEQAEPISEFYPYEPGAMFLIDGTWEVPASFTAGKLLIGYTPTDRPTAFRGAVIEVRDATGSTILNIDHHLRRLFPRTMTAEVVKVDAPILESRADRFQASARGGNKPKYWAGDAPERAVVAVVFPEETGWRSSGQGWVFVVSDRVKKGDVQHYFARALRAGEDDQFARAPELKPLRGKKIAQFGLGCIGAPSVVEFAKAGVGEIACADPDFFDPATAVRWVRGLTAAGFNKAGVTQGIIEHDYPFTKVAAYAHRLGNFDGNDEEALTRICGDADLIYDATAEPGVAYFLAEHARQLGIPYVGVSATPGGWGGVIVTLLPSGRTGCWYCFKRAQDDGKIPAATQDPNGSLQPAGCADPTFTAANFDISMVAISGVRAAMQVLLKDSTHGGASVITLRDEGSIIPIKAEAYPIDCYEDCPVCGAQPRFGSDWKM